MLTLEEDLMDTIVEEVKIEDVLWRVLIALFRLMPILLRVLSSAYCSD